MNATGGAKCGPHGMQGERTCARCGGFMCVECAPPGVTWCLSCAARPDAPQRRAARAHRLAQASWQTGLALVALFFPIAQLANPWLKGVLILALAFAGMSAGVLALVRRRGLTAPNVLLPAIAGLVLNALPLAVTALSLVVYLRKHG